MGVSENKGVVVIGGEEVRVRVRVRVRIRVRVRVRVRIRNNIEDLVEISSLLDHIFNK